MTLNRKIDSYEKSEKILEHRAVVLAKNRMFKFLLRISLILPSVISKPNTKISLNGDVDFSTKQMLKNETLQMSIMDNEEILSIFLKLHFWIHNFSMYRDSKVASKHLKIKMDTFVDWLNFLWSWALDFFFIAFGLANEHLKFAISLLVTSLHRKQSKSIGHLQQIPTPLLASARLREKV